LIAPTPRSMLACRPGRLLGEHKCGCEGDKEMRVSRGRMSPPPVAAHRWATR